MISAEGFEGASVASIAEHAGLSVGAFYQRFANKESLLSALHEETVMHNISDMRRAFDPSRWDGKTAFAVLEELVRGLLQVSKRDVGFQRACYQRALTDPSFAEREARERRELAELVRPLLLERLPGGGQDAKQGKAIDFCLTMVTGIATDFDVAENFRVAVPDLSRDELAAYLLQSCCTMLSIDAER